MSKFVKKDKSNKMNPLLWFLVAVVIPILFALILAYIIFSIAGVNVSGWIKDKTADMPIVSSMMLSEEEQDLKRRNEKLETSVEDKDKEIEQLNHNIDDLEGTIDGLEKDVLKLEKNSTDNEEEDDGESEEDDVSMTTKQMAGSFKDMEPEQAALIIQRLDQDTAVSILTAMSNKVRGHVLEAMDAEQAADLTKELIGEQ